MPDGSKLGRRAPSLLAYTDLFKQCQKRNLLRRGDVVSVVDRVVGRLIYQLSGASPASAVIQLPQTSTASLCARGRFLYILLRLSVCRPYAIQAQLVTTDKLVHRLIISNQLQAQGSDARMRRTGVHLYLEVDSECWTLLAIDLASAAAAASDKAFAELKSLALCGNMAVRSAFCSDLQYSWESLPDDVALTATDVRVVWVPEEPAPGIARLAAPTQRPARPTPPVPRMAQRSVRQLHPQSAGTSPLAQPRAQEVEVAAVMQPDPVLSLQHISGYSGQCLQGLAWAPGGCELVFAAGCAVVAMQPGGGQRMLHGSTRPVSALALSGDGSVLASAEGGPEGEVKLWSFKQGHHLYTLPASSTGAIVSLALSSDGNALITAAVDVGGMQQLVWWNIAACRTGGKARELARQRSDHSILSVSFVPFQPDKALTCGKNSVRVYRFMDGQLRGLSVPMGSVQALRKPHSCGTLASATCSSVGEVFTCIAFEHGVHLRRPEVCRALVGTASGAVFAINPDQRVVEGVHQLHDGPVHAVAAHEGFVATASGDRMLRVWGSDLQQLYMEARHEGPVTGLSISPDGLQVATGTVCGTVGLLDVRAQAYTTLLRAHTGAVHGVASTEDGTLFCTVSADGTVLVWDAVSQQQLLEFFSPKEQVLCVACSADRGEVACGFDTATVRVFAVGTASLVQESQQHSAPVCQLAYGQHGRTLFSLGADGVVCCYAASSSYSPTKLLCSGFPVSASCMASSCDGKVLAVATTCKASGMQSVLLVSTATLDVTAHLAISPGAAVQDIKLLPGQQLVMLSTTDGRLLGYSCNGDCVLEVVSGHQNGCQAMAIDESGTFLVTGGSDGMLSVWGLHELHQPGSSSCRPVTQDESQPKTVSTAPGATGTIVATQPVIRTLPCQRFAGHPGAVYGLAFVGKRQLISVGAQAVVCSWWFGGQSCNHVSAGKSSDTTAVAVFKLTKQHAQPEAQLATHEAHTFSSTSASCTADSIFVGARPSTSVARSTASAKSELREAGGTWQSNSASLPRQQHPFQLLAVNNKCPLRAPSGLEGADRLLGMSPLQHVRNEEGSTCNSLPSNPRCSRRGKQWSSLCTAYGKGEWQVQGVKQQQHLKISCTRGVDQRSMHMAVHDVDPKQSDSHSVCSQLQLQPPHACVEHVLGFAATAGFSWQPSLQRVICAAGNIVVAQQVGADVQQQLVQLEAPISAIACTADGQLLATAVMPAAAVDPPHSADIYLYQLENGGANLRAKLQFHSFTAQALEFSHDGAWLASVGCSAEPSLALWDASAGSLVAAVLLPAQLTSLAWLEGAAAPTFYTTSEGALTQWQLGGDDFSSVQVHLGKAFPRVQLTAVSCAGLATPHSAPVLLAGDGSGGVWELQLDDEQDVRQYSAVAQLEGQAVTVLRLDADGQLLAAGTEAGALALLQRNSEGWDVVGCHDMDGAVLRVEIDAGAKAAVAATAMGTLWSVGTASKQQPTVLLCGQAHPVTGWQLASGAAWRRGLPLLALASASGVAVWQLDLVGGNIRSPLVEFCQLRDASHVTIAPDGSACAAAFVDGSICMFDLREEPGLTWKVPPLRQQSQVAGLVLMHRLRGCKVLVMHRDGSLAVLEGSSGQVVHRIMPNFEPSCAKSTARTAALSKQELYSLAVCPSDTSLLALTGREQVVVVKLQWAKTAAMQTIAKLQLDGQACMLPGSSDPAAVTRRVVAAWSTRHQQHVWCTCPDRPGQLILFDASPPGAVIKTALAPVSNLFTALAVHPREELLAAGTSDGKIVLFQPETEAWTELAGHGNSPVVGLAFSPCGKRLFTGSQLATFVWDLSEQEGNE